MKIQIWVAEGFKCFSCPILRYEKYNNRYVLFPVITVFSHFWVYLLVKLYIKDLINECIKITWTQEGFLRCQTPTSTVKLKVEGCRVKNGGCIVFLRWGVIICISYSSRSLFRLFSPPLFTIRVYFLQIKGLGTNSNN